jgi:hypothetical protein
MSNELNYLVVAIGIVGIVTVLAAVLQNYAIVGGGLLMLCAFAFLWSSMRSKK